MTEQDKILEYKLRMNNSEIMTIEQLKEYKLLFDRIIDGGQRVRPQIISAYEYNNKILCWPSRPEGWRRSDQRYCKKDMYYQLNEYMNKFIAMQEEEKIIWAFATNFKHAGSNILLTNKGKILYIEFNLVMCDMNGIDLINY